MNDISFTSRINFVTAKEFDSFRRGAYVDFRTQCQLTPVDKLTQKVVSKLTGENLKHPRLDVVAADEFYTDVVRTCPAGGVVNTKTGQAAGFHSYDCLENFESAEDVLENLFHHVPNPDRALLIGSKNLSGSDYSIPLFQKLYEGITKRVPNVTVIREHTFPYSESEFHYALKNDTWTIHSMYKPLTDYREFDVKSKEDLDKCFKEVRIANGDVLMFNGK